MRNQARSNLLKYHLQLMLICGSILSAQVDSASVDSVAYTPQLAPGTLFHEPPSRGILNDRPYQIYLFVNVDSTSIKSVSLQVKNDSSKTYREFLMMGQYGRYGHQLQVTDLIGSALQYFFIVELVDYGLLAYPQDIEGQVLPFHYPLVAPSREYFQGR